MVDPSEGLCYLFAFLDAAPDFHVEIPAQLLESCETIVGDVGLSEVVDDVVDCGIVFSGPLTGGFLVLLWHVDERGRRDCDTRWLRKTCYANIYAGEVNWCQRERTRGETLHLMIPKQSRLQTLQRSAAPVLHKLRTRQTGSTNRIPACKNAITPQSTVTAVIISIRNIPQLKPQNQ
jgi:hypothetical protein